MQIVDAIKNLTVAMKGSGTVDDIDENQIADCIQYIADNWSTIKKNNSRKWIHTSSGKQDNSWRSQTGSTCK